MKNIYLRTALRQPVWSIFLVLLCGGVSLAFLFQVLQYGVLEDAVEDVSGYYRAIAEITTDDPEQTDPTECLALLEENPYVDFAQFVNMGSGVLDGMYNVSGHFFSRGENRLYQQGTLLSHHLDVGRDGQARLTVRMNVTEVIVGQPEIAPEAARDYVVDFTDADAAEAMYSQLEVGASYLFCAEGEYDDRGLRLFLCPLDGEELFFYPVAAGQEIDWTAPPLDRARDAMLLAAENQHSVELRRTKDMTAIPHIEEQFHITEGRMLTREDDLNASPVCVIRQEFADLRELSVGDTLTITMRDLDVPYHGYIMPEWESKPWQEAETATATYTIVGIASCLDPLENYAFYYSTVFVPDSCYPSTWPDHAEGYYVSGVSFVLDSPEHQEPFLASCSDSLAAIGAQVRFLESGWSNFYETVKPMQHSAGLNAVLFGCILALGLVLVVSLYTILRRKEMALQRAMGVSAGTAACQSLVPLLLFGSAGAALGTASAYWIGMRYTESFWDNLDHHVGTIRFSAVELLPFAGGIVLVLLLIGSLALAWSVSRPLLLQLQGGRVAPKKQSRAAVQEDGPLPQVNFETHSSAASLVQAAPQQLSTACSIRYLLRRSLRAPWLLLLALATAAAMLVGLYIVRWNIDRNQVQIDDLYNSIEVHGSIAQKSSAVYIETGAFIPAELVENLRGSGYLQEVFLEAGDYITIHHAPQKGTTVKEEDMHRVVLRIVEDLTRLREVEQGTISIEFEPGWDVSNFTDERRDPIGQSICGVLLSESYAEILGVGVGDEICFSLENGNISRTSVNGIFSGEAAFQMIVPMEQFFAFAESFGSRYTRTYTRMEFVVDPAFNRSMGEFRAKAEAWVEESSKGAAREGSDYRPAQILVLRDDELTQTVEPLEKNLSLLRLLYPITQGISVVLMALLAAVIVFQWRRDTALLRVLGSPRRRVCAMLCAGPTVFIVLGIGIGVAIAGTVGSTGGMGVCILLQIAAVLASAVYSALYTTARNPLELLQVKE